MAKKVGFSDKIVKHEVASKDDYDRTGTKKIILNSEEIEELKSIVNELTPPVGVKPKDDTRVINLRVGYGEKLELKGMSPDAKMFTMPYKTSKTHLQLFFTKDMQSFEKIHTLTLQDVATGKIIKPEQKVFILPRDTKYIALCVKKEIAVINLAPPVLPTLRS